MTRRPVCVAAAALLLATTACAGVETAGDREAPPAPTTTTPTTTVTEPEVTYTPVEAREPAPRVQLPSGEIVPLFEEFDHGNFMNSTVVDNPWLPLQPGTRLVFEGVTRDGDEEKPHLLVLTVTDLVKVIDGVASIVVWDVDWSDGDLVETELAFYAQDDNGTVWRMGEYPEEWEEGEFLDAPSWIAGVGDARAGIAMRPRPALGVPSYSQGWGPDVGFNDRAFVWEMGGAVCVVASCYDDVLVMDEFNDEEPDAHQLKYYARGIGNIQVGWRGASESVEELQLVEITRLTPDEMDDVREAALTLEQRAYILRPETYGPTEPAFVPGEA